MDVWMLGLVMYEIMTLRALPELRWLECCRDEGADPCNCLHSMLQNRSEWKEMKQPLFMPGAIPPSEPAAAGWYAAATCALVLSSLQNWV